MGVMSFLLDTHTWLWWLFDDERLSKTARGIIQDPNHSLYVSAASAWEIATKHRLGKLDSAAVLVQDIPGYVTRTGCTELPITVEHAARAGSFPQPHRDPFDRMLAAQATIEGLRLVTRDPAIPQFGVEVVW